MCETRTVEIFHSFIEYELNLFLVRGEQFLLDEAAAILVFNRFHDTTWRVKYIQDRSKSPVSTSIAM